MSQTPPSKTVEGSVGATDKASRPRPSHLAKFFNSDIFWSLKHSPVAALALFSSVFLVALALLAPVIAPQNPFDLASIDVSFANLPPVWMEGGDAAFLLGTDDQGRDLLSAMLYGMRLSLAVSVAAVLLSILTGVSLGLIAGFLGGWIDAFIMRICDIMLSFPAILLALLIDGILRAALPAGEHDALPYVVLVSAITLSGWVPYARTVRGMTLVERGREYVLSARVIGVKAPTILRRHVLPNVLGPVYVLGTLHVATAILTEATLSFLGVGVPPTTPSLGTLIRIGGDFLFSGEWWMTVFPGLTLIALILSVNLAGDWLRDATNPSLSD